MAKKLVLPVLLKQFAEEFMITLSNMLFLQHKLLCYLKSVAHGKFAKNTTITVQHINTSGPP